MKGPSGKGLMQHERVCLEGGSTWGLLDPSWVHKDPLELFAWEKKSPFWCYKESQSPQGDDVHEPSALLD